MSQQSNRSLFAMIIGVVAVLAVTVVAVLVYMMNRDRTVEVQAPDIAVVDQETGAIALGSSSADRVLETHIDFMCPFCGEFERSWGAAVADAVDDGSLQLRISPVRFLDAQSKGTEYSSRAAGSLYCLADEDPDAVLPYMAALYADQPEEGEPGFTDDELVGFAADQGVSSSAFKNCVTERPYQDLIEQLTSNVPVNPQSGKRGIPAVTLDGEWVDWTKGPAVAGL